ncbi:MAG: hypothetical protein LBB72_08130 [Spirochaetaceae bacterium]|nr:hypothetical protein [Spirochaetaceae bacterium]
MTSGEMISLLGKVISSWQVIVVTIVLLIYLKLVFFVANPRYSRHSDFSSYSKPGKKKKERPAKAAAVSSDNDDLGLEEE